MNSKQKSIVALFPPWSTRPKVDSLQLPGTESAVHQLFSDLFECHLGDPLLRDSRAALISVNPEFIKLRRAAEFFDSGLYAMLMFAVSKKVRKVYRSYAKLAMSWLKQQMDDGIDLDVDWSTILKWALMVAERALLNSDRTKL